MDFSCTRVMYVASGTFCFKVFVKGKFLSAIFI